MPKIKYKGKRITVSNPETLDGTDVDTIPLSSLFVSTDSHGKKWAFTIKELEDHTKRCDELNNFYAKENFSVRDMKKLKGMSDYLAEFFKNYTKDKEPYLDVISDETVEQMMSLYNRSGMRCLDADFEDSVRAKYSHQELEDLSDIDISLQDLVRGEAFSQFKQYYENLPQAEKDAIDAYPGVKEKLKSVGLGSSFSTILKLPKESCLGGTSEVCRFLASNVQMAKDIKKINASGIDSEVKESKSTTSTDDLEALISRHFKL